MTRWAAWADSEGSAIRDAGQWRSPRTFAAAGPAGRLPGEADPEQDVISFASNDYLGLSQHPAVKAGAIEAIEQWGAGSGAARLIVGSRPLHAELEHELAEWRGAEAAVLFSTGFAANTGTLAAISGPGVRIISDELNHASIIDGCRMGKAAGAQLRVARHVDLDHVATLLAEPGADRQVVVTDTVFSMDGDVAPVLELADLCAKHDALLVLDDAHAVLQPFAELVDAGAEVLRVGTLSKTFGSFGGFVTGSRVLADLLINRARPYIFTTAPPPGDVGASLAALAILRSPEGDELRLRLRHNIGRLLPGHATPIVAVIVGDELDAVDASSALLKRGLLVPAIRPPTVAPGSSRLRIALSAAHDSGQVDQLASALTDLHLHPSDGAADRDGQTA